MRVRVCVRVHVSWLCVCLLACAGWGGAHTWAPWSPLPSGWWGPARRWRRSPCHRGRAPACTSPSPGAPGDGHAGPRDPCPARHPKRTRLKVWLIRTDINWAGPGPWDTSSRPRQLIPSSHIKKTNRGIIIIIFRLSNIYVCCCVNIRMFAVILCIFNQSSPLTTHLIMSSPSMTLKKVIGVVKVIELISV